MSVKKGRSGTTNQEITMVTYQLCMVNCRRRSINNYYIIVNALNNYPNRELLTTNTVKVYTKSENQDLWNKIPSLGREAMIAIIEDELKLIRTLIAENEEEYNKLYFLKSGNGKSITDQTDEPSVR
jgi:hypothetical protein